MENGLLSLKWENHKKTFSHIVASLRHKDNYCDATISCDGKFYNVHKLILSACSLYLEKLFEATTGLNSLLMHPVIILQDIRHEHLEALLDYMYVGEVNILQADLEGLIRAAECLKIKGLAGPDAGPDDDILMASSNVERRTKRSLEDENSFEKRFKNKIPKEKHVSEETPSILINEEDILPSHNVRSDSQLSQENVMLHEPVKEETFDTDTGYSEEYKLPDEQAQSEQEQYKTEQNELETNIIQISIQKEPVRTSSQVTLVSAQDMANVSSFPDSVNIAKSDQVSEQYMRSIAPSVEQYSTAVVEYYSPEGQLLTAPVDGSKLWAQRGASQCVICPFCSKSYSRKSAFLCHYKIHTGERPHVCPQCGHRFIQKSTLDAHIKTHTGEKPFSCPYCSFRFTRRSSVKDHIHRRHKNEALDIVVSVPVQQ